MARRSDHTREEQYEMVLAAAREIVVAGGLEALTARKVANAIGYSPGTLYNLFDDFDDLIVHLNGRTLDELHEHLSSVPRTQDPMRDLKRLLRAYLGYLEDNRNLWNVLFEYRLPNNRSLPDWYVNKVAKVLGLIEVALSPLCPSRDPDTLADSARVLWASLHGICSLSGSGKLQVVSDQTVHKMAETLVDCFVSGLQTVHE
ncbi:MAG: TetR/AcrR family transcriptional regulator [Alphaproteobacteria bacterium]|nr:TetR/AcrR family transcriptional regulator [Alphaproteobacteria bacterium]